MSDSFGLKLGIEGEKEFKSALKDINSTFKVLGSELTLVSSQFDKQDRSVEAVSARSKVLNKEIEEQKKKIALLASALENATQSFGESDKRTQAWQIQLNNAKAELNKLDKELAENEKALEDTADGFDDAEKELLFVYLFLLKAHALTCFIGAVHEILETERIREEALNV